MSRAHSPTDSQSVGGKPQPGTQYLTAEIESEDTALKHYSILPESRFRTPLTKVYSATEHQKTTGHADSKTYATTQPMIAGLF